MEKHLSKTNWCFWKGKEDGLRQEVPVENDIRETDWEREMTVQNIHAKEKMAQELREMGFENHCPAPDHLGRRREPSLFLRCGG